MKLSLSLLVAALFVVVSNAPSGFAKAKLPPFKQPVVEKKILSKHRLEFKPGDRVVFMGDTLAERADLFGYFETLLQARFPEMKLTFRNLGYSADTPASLLADLKGTMEYNHGSNRALNFGTMTKHLTDAKADVIFLCVGMNDSFNGDAGLADFNKSLQELIAFYRKEKFNGKSEPRLVIVSPIAHEHLGGEFPDPQSHNKQLEKYTQAMRKIAEANKLPFLDLYVPTNALMNEVAPTRTRVTINGIHLNEIGYWAAAHYLMDQFGFTLQRWVVNLKGNTGNVLAAPTLPSPPLPDGVKAPSSLLRYLPYVIGAADIPNDGRPPDQRELALVIDREICLRTSQQQLAFGPFLHNSPMQNAAEKLRLAIVARNQEWFYKWRAVNGEYIYGRRAAPFGIKNFPGEMKEMEATIAKLDAEIHKLNRKPAAKLQTFVSPTSAVIKLPDVKRYTTDVTAPPAEVLYKQVRGFIGGARVETADDIDAALKHFKLQDGYEINLFASEKDFPLHNPLAMAWDAKGRLWVTTMPSYPQYLPGFPPNDKILILEDTKGTGKADKCTVFADNLYLPTGLEFGNGGVYVAAQPNLLFLKDTNGDDVADSRETILHGFGTGDSHHAIHTFTWSPEGALHFNEGIFHRSNVETPWGPVRQRDAAIYRFQPKSHKLETYVSYNFANPWGQVYDRWGFNFIADASGGSNYNALPMTGFVEFPRQHPGMKVFTSVVRPTCGCEIVSSRHFPPEAQGNFLVNNDIGFQGIKQHQVIEEKSGFTSKELPPLLFSTDRNFRPVDIKFGPDGALYIVDWYNPLIGHMQHSIRDPGRDHIHGRIWRITAKGRPLNTPVKIAGEPIAKLLDLLKEYEDRTRYRVRAELRERDAFAVKAAIEKWLGKLKEDDAQYEHHLLEALWVQQGINQLDEELLVRLLHAKDFRARGAATRALRNEMMTLKAQGQPSLGLERAYKYLEGQVNDVHPRVRLEAVVALSFFKDTRAAEIALQVLEHPTDYYLDYGLKETMTTLAPYWKAAIALGKPLKTKAAGAAYLFASVPTADLLKMAERGSAYAGDGPRAASVASMYSVILARSDATLQHRHEAIEGLARLLKRDYQSELVNVIERLDKDHLPGDHSNHVLLDLGKLLAGRDRKDLTAIRPTLEQLIIRARLPVTRQIAYVALVAADQTTDRVWAEAAKDLHRMPDFVAAIPLIKDTKQRAELYAKVRPLIDGLPPELDKQAQAFKGIVGRYVRVELPGKNRTLTLAEVEIYSGGKNVALGGKATQSSTDAGGIASRAIDGNKHGIYFKGGQTHTQDSTDPWWEVDLGAEVVIDGIGIWNRTDSDDGMRRLHNFSIIVLDAHRHVTYRRDRNPSKYEPVHFDVRADPVDRIRLAALRAIPSIPNHDAETFSVLANLVRSGKDRNDAIRGLRQIPAKSWPVAELKSLAESLYTYYNGMPTVDRVEPSGIDTLQLGNEVAARVPGNDGRILQNRFSKLGIHVILIRTIPHNMVFDVAEFTVEAGRQMMIVLENNDIMPHNLIIGEPGSLTEIGQLAEKMASDPDAFKKGFVPASKKVLHATRMLQPGETDRLQFAAPQTPGNYVVVCTFPGHWTVMNATMNVVPSLSKIPVTKRIKYLEDKKWTIPELADDLDKIAEGRNFARGKELFTVRSCNQCHRIGNDGGTLGPDLNELPKKLASGKFSKADLLREVIDPTAFVDKKYQLVAFELISGQTVQGVIIHEDGNVIRVAKNQVEKPIDIKRGEVAERTPLPKLSIMPNGLLDRLSKDDVLDLLAFIASGGDAAHPAFRRKE